MTKVYKKKSSQQMTMPPTISSLIHFSLSSRHSSVCTMQLMVQLKAYFLQRRLIPFEELASFLKMFSDYIITEKEELSAILEFYEVST
jgi:hypothetical protein